MASGAYFSIEDDLPTVKEAMVDLKEAWKASQQGEERFKKVCKHIFIGESRRIETYFTEGRGNYRGIQNGHRRSTW